jgi:peptidoglycan-associated lipoprotein
MKKLLALAIAGATLVACSSNKAPAPEAAATPAPETTETPGTGDSSAPVASNNNSVYFAFNKYNINEDYAALIKANAKYITENPQAKVQIEGNTDDVGSVEYNLSLGQRRADAVKKALIADGAAHGQIEATSNGKLKHKFDNSTDEGRAMDRRSDIIYKDGQPAGYSTDSNGLPLVDASVYDGAAIVQGVQ